MCGASCWRRRVGRKAAAPSVATSHLRRSAVRLLFRVLRQASVVDHDPTLDVVLPARSSLAARPLTDDEIALGRSFSSKTLGETRQPAAWALAEATARTSELPAIRIRDVDLDDRPSLDCREHEDRSRWGQLTDWGVETLARRIAFLDAPPEAPLIYDGAGSGESRQASACAAISETLRRAGLAGEPDVRPVSVAAWAGARILEQTGQIEAVARALGMRSLDRAARLIGWDWTTRDQRRSMRTRTAGVSALERVEALLANPALYELADLVPDPAPDAGGRHRDYPTFMWLFYEALISVYGSARRVEAELAHPLVWNLIRKTIRRRFPGRRDLHLSERPMRRHHYLYARNRYLTRPRRPRRVGRPPPPARRRPGPRARAPRPRRARARGRIRI